MLAIVNTPGGPEPVAIREIAEPEPQPNEALVAVHAFSLNRGELRLFSGPTRGLAAGAGHCRDRAARRRGRQLPAGRDAGRRPVRLARLGRARRGAGPSYRADRR